MSLKSGGLQFNGTSDYIQVPNSQSLNPSYITIEVWFMLNTASLANQIMISKNSAYGFCRGDFNNSKLSLAIGQSPTGWKGNIAGNTTLQAKTLYHGVGTFDGQKINLYLNGLLDGSGVLVGSIPQNNNQPLFISTYVGASWFMNGTIYATRIYNRALSPQEVYSNYTGQVVRSGLAGEWLLNANSGNTAKDTSGNGNDGTLNGCAWANHASPTDPNVPKIRQGMKFNGISDYVNCGSPTNLNFGTGSFTVETWVKINVSKTGKRIIAKRNGYVGFEVYVSDNYVNELDIYIGSASSAYGVITTNGANINNNQWNHVVIVCDRVLGVVKPYINGVLVGTNGTNAITNNITSTDNSANANIGTNSALSSNVYFQGIIGATRIYNRALSSSEVASNYNGQVATNGLVGQWLTDGTANDTSGYGNNGTVTGAVPVIKPVTATKKAAKYSNQVDYSFSRGSVEPYNGLYFPNDTPRVDSNGVIVEEGTTNVLGPNPTALTSGGSSITSNNGVYTVTTANQSRSVVRFKTNNSYPTSPNQTWTGSIKVQGPIGSTISVWVGGYSNGGSNTQTFTLDGTMQTLVLSRTLDSTANNGDLFIDVGTNNNVLTFTVQKPQVEQKSYATSFTDNPLGRVAETLTFPTANVLSASAGTIECRVIPTNATNGIKVLIDAFNNSGGNGGYWLGKNSSGYWGIPDMSLSSNIAVTGNVVYHIALSWSSSSVKLYVNGVLCGTTSKPADFNLNSAGIAHICCFQSNPAYTFNGSIKSLRISNTARSDTDIAYTYQRSLQNGYKLDYDDFTTKLLNW